jgi:hypothetical protein
MQKSAWAEITERLVSSPDESPRQRNPACTFDGCFDLSVHGLRPRREGDFRKTHKFTVAIARADLLDSRTVKNAVSARAGRRTAHTQFGASVRINK